MMKSPYFMTIIFLVMGIANPIVGQPAITADTLTIIHITDTHICNLTEYHPVFVEKRRQYGNGVAPLTQFLATVPFQMNADLVVSTGDNIDFFRSTTAKGTLLDTQIEQYAQVLDFSPIPVFCTLGNHDIQQYWMTSDSTYVAQKHNAQQARAAWIRNIACFRDGTYYSRLYQVGGVRYRLIFLDNGYRADSQPIPFIINQAQLDWLTYQLDEAADDVEILFMHLPLPIEDANHDGNSFAKTPIALDASTIAANELLKILNNHASIRLLITGHGHKNIIEDAKFPGGHTITQVETDAFGQSPQNWRLLRFTREQIFISKPGSAEVEYAIPSQCETK